MLLLGITLEIEDTVGVVGVAVKAPVPVESNADPVEVIFPNGNGVKLTGLMAGVDSRVVVGGPNEAEVNVDAVLRVMLDTEGENGGRLNDTGGLETRVEVSAGPGELVAIGAVLVSMELDSDVHDGGVEYGGRPLPDTELAVPAADTVGAVELDTGNGAELGSKEDRLLVSGYPVPVDIGPELREADVLPAISGVGLIETLPEEDIMGVVLGTVPEAAAAVLEFAAGYGGELDAAMGDSVRESVPSVGAVPCALLEDTSDVVLLSSGYGAKVPEPLGTAGTPLAELVGKEKTIVAPDATLSDELDSVEVNG